MRTLSIKASQLGTNCWLPNRFIGSNRCPRWDTCDYPEKVTCQARLAEIRYHEEQAAHHMQQVEKTRATIAELSQELTH